MIFTIDIGTSTIKGGIFDNSCRLIHSASAQIKLIQHNNLYEIDSLDWIKAFKNICLEILKYKEIITEIKTIVISGNGPTLTPIDKNGKPLYHAITWMDHRGRKETEQLLKNNSVNPSFFLSKAYWIYKNKPDIYARTEYFISCPEFLIHYLTGNAFTILPNEGFKNYIWTDDAISGLGMEKLKFPEFIQPGAEAGTIKRKLAEELNLNPAINIVVGGYDFLMSLLGSGTITPGTTCDRAGTSEGINHCSIVPTTDDSLICTPHLVKDLYNVSGIISTTGKAIDWFKNNSFYKDKNFNDIYNDVKATIPGKLIFLPHLAGERSPQNNKHVSGAFIGLELNHSYKHMARAVLESIGFAIKRIIEVMEKNGLTINELTIAGSLSKIDILNQVKADITGKVILVPEISDSELVGNACMGLVYLGKFKSLKEASLNCVKISKKIYPDTKLSGFYSDMFNIYELAYNNLLPVFEKLGKDL